MLIYLKNDGKAFMINRYDNMDLLMNIFENYAVSLKIQPIKSYADRDPKNLIIELTKSDNFSSKVISDLVVHDRTSKDGYNKYIQEWMK